MAPPLQRVRLGQTNLEVCRMGLAGGYGISAGDVRWALDLGVDLLWAAPEWHGIAQAVRELPSSRRQGVVIAAGGDARDSAGVRVDLERRLRELGTDYLDLFLCHYVESQRQAEQLWGAQGGLAALAQAQQQGLVRYIAASVHSRPLAARMAASGQFPILFLRYNPAHTGAEREVFPTTRQAGIGVVVFVATRWGELFSAPRSWQKAPPQPHELYRFPLEHPAVHAVMAAPSNARQLEEDLQAVQGDFRLSPERMEELRQYGQMFREMA